MPRAVTVTMVSFNIVNLFCMMFVCVLVGWVQAEVFTAISDCEPLLDTHRQVINHLDDYLQKEEKRLMALKMRLNIYKTEHEKAMNDVLTYLGNPINVFLLIKRLTVDLEKIDHKVKTDHFLNKGIPRENAMFPTTEDLIGAAQALTRLQDTYELDVKELSEGRLNGVTNSSSMSADDCFELGRALYSGEDYEYSIAWMKEALRKYRENENFIYSFTVVDVMDHISWSYYTLAVDPTHTRARANEALFENTLAESLSNDTDEQQPEADADLAYEYRFEVEKYKALCRGDYEIFHEVTKKLHCFYLTENHSFLRLAPIKAEKKYADPDIYLFYDVISDEEIAHVKSMAKTRFTRAEIYEETGETAPANYRISKTAWLANEESDIVARISRRTADFTGLNVDMAEDLQVANYGTGGHYDPHFDFDLKGSKAFTEDSNPGNRIATVLFYMSEVAEGGATVFTHLGLSVFPVKNAALFWMNLHPSGEGDLSTIHAGCPVLRGVKWVSNKWMILDGQELIKKVQCTLEYQPEEWLRPVPDPILKPHRKRVQPSR